MSLPREYITNIFIAYSRNDKIYLNELLKHLAPLIKGNELVKIWYDGDITPGMEWLQAIDNNLSTADIILLLISSDSLASDSFNKEMTTALERHQKGESSVIPIILRSCLWSINKKLKKLQAAPTDGKAISEWSNRDKAYVNISECIEKYITEAKDKHVDKIIYEINYLRSEKVKLEEGKKKADLKLADLTAKQAKVDERKKTIELQKSSLKSEQTKLEQDKEKIEALQNELTSKQTQIDEEKKAIELQKSSLKSEQTKLEQDKEKIEALQNELTKIDEEKKVVEALKSDIKSEQAKLEKDKQKVELFQKELELIQEQVNQKTKTKSKSENLEPNKQIQIDEQKEEVESKRSRLKTEQNQLEETINKFELHKKELEKKLAELSMEKNELISEKEHLKLEWDRFNNMKNKAEQQTSSNSSKINWKYLSYFLIGIVAITISLISTIIVYNYPKLNGIEPSYTKQSLITPQLKMTQKVVLNSIELEQFKSAQNYLEKISKAKIYEPRIEENLDLLFGENGKREIYPYNVDICVNHRDDLGRIIDIKELDGSLINADLSNIKKLKYTKDKLQNHLLTYLENGLRKDKFRTTYIEKSNANNGDTVCEIAIKNLMNCGLLIEFNPGDIALTGQDIRSAVIQWDNNVEGERLTYYEPINR